MSSRSSAIALCASLTAVVSLAPAWGQESTATKACSEQWRKMEEAGKTSKGTDVLQFSSDCGEEQAVMQDDTAVDPKKAAVTAIVFSSLALRIWQCARRC